jgi:hypothetical protein
MNRIFTAGHYFTVPDGTDVSPFLNATACEQSDLAWGALGDMSIAAGRLLFTNREKLAKFIRERSEGKNSATPGFAGP